MDDRPPTLPPRRPVNAVSAGDAGNRNILNSTATDQSGTAAPARNPPERIATRTSNESAADDRDGVDSGYGGSNSGTPGDKKTAAADSYRPEEVVFGESGLFGRKPKKMHRYNIPISAAHRTRYCDLEDAFCVALARLLARKKKKHVKPLDIGLVVLGHDLTDARPCILVTCNKSIVRYVSSFFDESWVKEELNPDSSHGFPSFDLYVKSIPCKPKAAAAVEIFERKTHKDYLQDITNGYPIFAKTESGWKRSTLGGFVEVVKSPNHIDLYGFTAGHLISPWDSEDSDSDDVSDEDEDDFDNPLDIELDDVSTGDEDDSDNLGNSAVMLEPQSAVTDRSHTFEIPDKSDLSPLGLGFEIESTDMGSKALDYALLSVVDKSRCFNSRPLEMPGSEASQQQEDSADPFDTRSVILLNAMGVGLKGNLSSHMSSLMLSSTAGFVKTYKLELTDSDEVTEGDSGAWVIDSSSNVVYGHVVAVDLYGNAHVIPLTKVLNDIKSGLNAIDVRLASSDTPAAPANQSTTGAPPFVNYLGQKPPPDSGYNTREASKNSTTDMSAIGRLPPPPPPPAGYNMAQNWNPSVLGPYGPLSGGSYGGPKVPLNYYQNTYPYYNAMPTNMTPQYSPAYGLAAAAAAAAARSAPPLPSPPPSLPVRVPVGVPTGAGPRTGYDSGYVSKQTSPQNSGDALKSDDGDQQDQLDEQDEQLQEMRTTIDDLNFQMLQLKEAHYSQSQALAALQASMAADSTPSPAKRHSESADQRFDFEQPLAHDSTEKEVNPNPDSSATYVTNADLERLSMTALQAKHHQTILGANLERALDQRFTQSGKISFRDPKGVRYVLPLSRVKKSEDIKSFIDQTVVPGLSHGDDDVRMSIQKGRYDLKDRWGHVIPLQFWEDLVEAGPVTMHTWN